ncbi:hypothetical protein PMI40_02534, partial [Herbaspirillum sp. YR522]
MTRTVTAVMVPIATVFPLAVARLRRRAAAP